MSGRLTLRSDPRDSRHERAADLREATTLFFGRPGLRMLW